ncbi:Extended synaptotagmin-3 [Acropora cervicornis]|uniref:Extended synaptotagmin-3 n=1 Tax=Acropora cervicornis TaxID=6130 RepID=A0AAD9PSH4_ACRCE|nr:Extended synaptotagmin-3 [Acropora cervicornis]
MITDHRIESMEKTRKTRNERILQARIQAFAKDDGRKLCFYFCVASMLWLLGRCNVSFAWILAIISVYVLGEYHLQRRSRKRCIFRKMKDESNLSRIKTFAIPPKHLSDKENAVWLNEIISRSWSAIEGLTRNFLIENVEPELQQMLPEALKSLHFEKFELGNKPPYIGNIISYGCQKNSRPSEFMMDLDVFYHGDAQMKLTVKNVKIGITDFQINGTLRIILKLLLPCEPNVAGAAVFFLKRPRIAFNLTNLLNILEFPGLKKTLRQMVSDVIAKNVVLPNRIAIPLAGVIDASDLQYPVPEGVLRVHLVEARGLVDSDSSLIGSGSTDPYAVLEVGAQTFRTTRKKNDSSPVWQETFEAFVDNCEGQELQIYLYDHDIASKDTKIGEINFKICSVVEVGALDVWMPLEKAKQGRVHLKLDWYTLSSNPTHFRDSKGSESVAVLIVKLISAVNLPSRKKSILARKIHCAVSVGKITLSSTCAKGEELTWSQSLQFLLTDPHEEARIELMEGDSFLGFMVFPAIKLTECQDMTLQGSFPLQSPNGESGNGGFIACKFVLRALTPIGAASITGASKTDGKSKGCSENNHCERRPETPTMIPEVDGLGSPDATESSSSGSAEKSSTSGSAAEFDVSPSGSIADEISNGKGSAISGLDYLSRGDVSLSLIYNHRRNRLEVTILTAKIISSSMSASKANLYVQINLLPSRSKKTIRKTFSFPGSLSPKFNESFDYVIGLNQLGDRELQVAVRNERPVQFPGRRGDLIGSTTIKLCELSLSAGVTLNCELIK